MSLRRPSRYRGGQKVNDANIEINALLETQPFDDKPSSTGEVQFDEDGLTVVHRAIENGNYNLLILSLFKAKTIEERKKLVNAKTQKHLNADRPKGLTPFHMAAYARGKNHSMEETLYKMLIELQKHKGKIDELNSSGLSPLHYAAYRNSVLAVRVLTRCGCDLNAVNQEGRTPLMIACIRKAKEVITLLLNKRETLDFERKDRFGNTFLHLMAQYCDEDLINTFLDIDEILRIDDGRFFERINRVQKLINLPSQERRMTPLRIVVERGFLTALQRMRFLLRWVPAEPEKVERSQQKKNKEEERERIEKAKNETIKNNTDILHIAASIGNGSTNLLIVQELIKRIIMSSGPLAFGIFLDLLFNKDISKARYNVVELQRLIVWIKESDDLEFEMLQSYQYRSDQENQNLSNAAYECPIEELEELQNGKDEKSLAKSIIAPQPLSVWRLSDQNERISDESLLRIPGVLLDPEEIVVEKDKRASSIIELQEHSFSPIWRTSDQGDGRRFFSSTLSQQTTIDSGMIEEPEDIIEIMDSKERSKSIDKRDINGMTPLLHTAFTGAWEAAQALIKRSTALKPSELFFDENNAGENMIIVAAGNNHPEYLDKLFEELSKRQLLDKRFWSRSASSQTTPLHCVAENGSLKGTMKLIEEHARIDSLNSHNQTLLHVAAKAGHLPVVEYILRLPDIVSIINYKDYRWNTPLHLAAQFGFEEIIQALLRKGADPKIRNFYRKTAFDVAVVKGHLECVKILLKYFKIDGENDRIKAPIHYAAKHGHDNVVQYLLRHGAQIDILVNMESGESDETALTIALDFGRRNVAKKLLTKTNELDPLKSRSWESLLFHKKKRTEKDQDPYDTPMRRLIKDFPDLAELVMDQCICESDGIITYNFEFIDDPFLMQLKDENGNETGEYRVFDERGRRAIMENGDVRREATLYSKNGSQIYKEHPIMLMAKSDNPETKKLLEHRLVVKFIDYRWSNLGRFVSFWLSLLPYAIFLILYTIILLNRVKVEELEVDDSVNATNESIINLTTFIDHNLATIPSETQRNINDLDLMSSNGTVWSTNLILSVIAFVFWCYLLIKEIFQCYSFGSKAYFSSGENIIELTVYGLSLTTIILKARIDNDPKNNDSQAFWIFASIVVVLSWLNLLMLISKWKTFGIFVRMGQGRILSYRVILCWLSVCSCFCNNDESEIDEEEQNEIETEKAQNEKQAKVEMSFIDERFAQESLASLSTEKLLALNQQSIYALQKEVKNLNTKLKDQEEEHHVKESKLVEKLDRISEMLEEMKNGKEFGSDKMQTGNQMETMKTLETMNNEDVNIEDDGKDSSSTEAEWSDELMDPPAVNFTETEEQEESDNEACASLATMPQFPLPNNHKRKLSTTRWALLESSPNDPADWKAQRFSDT
ncbi:unnamed protein product, partial [Mesorhabditis belari]|uniref:Uncharacterized protein n=1 Tax=Mesorhabditis belari TaxID=2138241 RepID=A0AAF3EYL6_9BILA